VLLHYCGSLCCHVFSETCGTYLCACMCVCLCVLASRNASHSYILHHMQNASHSYITQCGMYSHVTPPHMHHTQIMKKIRPRFTVAYRALYLSIGRHGLLQFLHGTQFSDALHIHCSWSAVVYLWQRSRPPHLFSVSTYIQLLAFLCCLSHFADISVSRRTQLRTQKTWNCYLSRGLFMCFGNIRGLGNP
jgi:hypothetical protein